MYPSASRATEACCVEIIFAGVLFSGRLQDRAVVFQEQ